MCVCVCTGTRIQTEDYNKRDPGIKHTEDCPRYVFVYKPNGDVCENDYVQTKGEQRGVLGLRHIHDCVCVCAPIFATLWRHITKGKGKNKTSPQGNLYRSKGLHKESCAQSLWQMLKYRDKGKNNGCLHKDAKTRMCVCVCVWSTFAKNIVKKQM